MSPDEMAHEIEKHWLAHEKEIPRSYYCGGCGLSDTDPTQFHGFSGDPEFQWRGLSRHLAKMLWIAAGNEWWYIVAADDDGMTIDANGSDPEELVNKVASWAQQEEDKWSKLGLVYMLVPGKDFQ